VSWSHKLPSNNEQRILVAIRHLVAMSPSATWHLDSMLERSVLGGGDLAHLPLLLPPSVHGCLLLFISHGGLLSFIHCCLLCHCW